MENAAIYIVPLRIGGGSRLKILEAMAMKKAIVTTSIGAEGLSVTPNYNILIEDKPQNFANAIVQLIDNTDLRNKISENGLTLVNEKYRWEQIAHRFNLYLKKIVEN